MKIIKEPPFSVSVRVSELKKRRKDRKIRQYQLSEALGITKQGYCSIERGRWTPRLEILANIAQMLSCTVDDLIIIQPRNSQFLEKK